ncbi:acetylajmalan esterase-like [Andrographis paniculata]|uniref:acetylajmalan esterase-like n=1 Tax=Andrographis paniculata TaxID=175694 RepID=UPI0021E84A7F|nr:acetylajmalan esterase-like [Andrographis paniculata]
MGQESSFGNNILSILAFLAIIVCNSSIYVVQGRIDPSRRIKCPIDSIYQLGDSISDTGNLKRLMPLNPATRSPYGKTFPGHPTGRWSDGRLMIDYIAMSLGLPLLNPHMDRTASSKNGSNFAVAGSTALGPKFYASHGIYTRPIPSIQTQLRLFKRHLATFCVTPRECRRKLHNSLVFVGEIGYNDIAYPYGEGKPIDTIRRYDARGCVKNLNELIATRNAHLLRDIVQLRKEFPQANIQYVDLYRDFDTLLHNGPQLGFNKTTLMKACCGGDPIFNPTGRLFCGNSKSAPLCPNPDNHIHWDGIHLTQEAYRHLAIAIIRDLHIKCPR